MVYETILAGLGTGVKSISHFILSSDGVRDFYYDLDRLLKLISGYDYLYVVVWYREKFHVHLLIKDCPYRLAWFDSNWLRFHGCIARRVSVDNFVNTAVYLSTQESIDDVVVTEEWC